MNPRVGLPFSLSNHSLAMHSDGSTSVLKNRAGPPPCVAGLNIGVAEMKHAPPHDGEMHPDGDELIFLIDGAISILLEESPDRVVELKAGEAFIVPKGIWHRILVHSPCRLLHATPGPGNESRPRARRM